MEDLAEGLLISFTSCGRYYHTRGGTEIFLKLPFGLESGRRIRRSLPNNRLRDIYLGAQQVNSCWIMPAASGRTYWLRRSTVLTANSKPFVRLFYIFLFSSVIVTIWHELI